MEEQWLGYFNRIQLATKKNGSWNSNSQKMSDENQTVSRDGALFIKTSPKKSVYHLTTSVNRCGYDDAKAPCPSMRMETGIWEMKKIRKIILRPPCITFISIVVVVDVGLVRTALIDDRVQDKKRKERECHAIMMTPKRTCRCSLL
jgi:hypothetical protein